MPSSVSTLTKQKFLPHPGLVRNGVTLVTFTVTTPTIAVSHGSPLKPPRAMLSQVRLASAMRLLWIPACAGMTMAL